MSNSNKVKR